jgi:hypothetical protein
VQTTSVETFVLVEKTGEMGFLSMKHSLASLIFLVACGGMSGPLDPGAGDSQGTGTKTLLVTGSATASPRVASAQVASDFDTAFSVRIELAGAVVTTGTVTVTSSTAATPLAFTTTGNDTGHWIGNASGYDEVYQLDVTSGTDNVTGVVVDGPDIQTITAPTAGATIDSTQPFVATWDRAAAADVATVQAGDGGPITIVDSGTYSIAPGTLAADKDKARADTFRLSRSNHVSPSGAVVGSEVEVGVQEEVDVVAAACPGC